MALPNGWGDRVPWLCLADAQSKEPAL
jgi:hypothetical protein